MNDKTLAQRLLDILPLLKDLETGQDCAEYAFAKGEGFQAMTYCPDAFEALRVLPEAIDTIEAQATRIEALEAALREAPAALNAMASQVDAEWRDHDKAAARHDAIVMAFKKKVRQALAGDDHGHR